MSVSVRELTKSKLIERLREISRGAPAPIGFGRAPTVSVPALLLMAVIPRNEPALAVAAVQGGADAVALRICGAATDLLGETRDLAAEEQPIKETIAAVGNSAIIGLIIGSNGHVSREDLDKIDHLGVDFVAAYPHLTPASFLELAEVGRLAILDQQGGQLARGINDLPIDSALVRIGRPSDSPPEMTVLDVALCRAAADAIHRPIVAFPSWTPVPADLEVLRDAGVEGMALVGPRPDASAQTIQETVRSFRTKVEQLGKPRGRRVALKAAPLVPKVAPATAEAEDDEGDDDDE